MYLHFKTESDLNAYDLVRHLLLDLKGCDSSFEVKCSNVKSCYK